MNNAPPVNNSQGSGVLPQARRSARIQEEFIKGGFHFVAIKDHILPSLCTHPKDQGDATCSRCQFAALSLPELPEMVFPHNKFSVSFQMSPGSYIEFNAFDALERVISDKLPDVQVAPSAVWQATRAGMGSTHGHPFDWTYTTDYRGTLVNCIAEPTTEIIDMEKLRQQDEIGFYAQITLYEDELADHGCAELTARVRVMPNFFFALMRFHLRIDHVLIRVCDTRLFGNHNSGYILREWSQREAKIQDLKHLSPDIIIDNNRVWSHLPVTATITERIKPKI